MRKIPATEFKAKCLELMDRVAEQRESYVITKRGKPVARLVPTKGKTRESIFGWLCSMGSIEGDVIHPAMTPGDWRSLADWDEMLAGGGSRTAGTAANHMMRRSRR